MPIRFIDLFAGLGGIRKGFEDACTQNGIQSLCVMTSEIKEHAKQVYQTNFPGSEICGDITKVDASAVPDFDILLAGFPCQPFSMAGSRRGFNDTRGTLFFEIERILKEKKPEGFLLENVPGLLNHEKHDKNADYGTTFSIMLHHLQNLGYHVSWKILNASEFGLPQNRERLYIIGNKHAAPIFPAHSIKKTVFSSVMEHRQPCEHTDFINHLLSYTSLENLKGKKISDKRNGQNNIHSWDLSLKGSLSAEEKILMTKIASERRKRRYAEEVGIPWTDGMPLTKSQIATFANIENLDSVLRHLTELGYLKEEYPKVKKDGKKVQDISLEKGFQIPAGKLSFEVGLILNPDTMIVPTLTATDMDKIYIPDDSGIRKMTAREGLRCFGYPENYQINLSSQRQIFDLLGNTVAVPVICFVAKVLLDSISDIFLDKSCEHNEELHHR